MLRCLWGRLHVHLLPSPRSLKKDGPSSGPWMATRAAATSIGPTSTRRTHHIVSLTRSHAKVFWQHLQQVYKDVYPEVANRSGSIVLFGCVASERHAASVNEELRDEHKHAPTYTSQQHYWRPVAERSLRHYGVKLHAACHEGYVPMYRYVACPSARKPLSELDPELYLSLDHPRGELLQRLLKAGDRHDRAVAGKRSRASSAAADESTPKRIRAGDLYGLVAETGIRNAKALQAHAQKLARDGSPQLAEFCTTRGTTQLQEILEAAWAVHDAVAPPVVATDFRVEKLRGAARDSPCVCNGVWIPGAVRVLQNNADSCTGFAHDVYRALALGAKRSTNVAIVGPPGCGKSMLLEPLDAIFKVSGKPQRESANPLEGSPCPN